MTLIRAALRSVIAISNSASNIIVWIAEIGPVIVIRYFVAVTRRMELLAHDIIQYVQPVKKPAFLPNASSAYACGPPLFVIRDDKSEKTRARVIAPATDTSHPSSPTVPCFANDDGKTKTPDPN
jgi:hypothetical protein